MAICSAMTLEVHPSNNTNNTIMSGNNYNISFFNLHQSNSNLSIKVNPNTNWTVSGNHVLDLDFEKFLQFKDLLSGFLSNMVKQRSRPATVKPSLRTELPSTTEEPASTKVLDGYSTSERSSRRLEVNLV